MSHRFGGGALALAVVGPPGLEPGSAGYELVARRRWALFITGFSVLGSSKGVAKELQGVARSRTGITCLEHRRDRADGLDLHPPEDVRVGAERERGVLVPESFLDHLRRHVPLEQVAAVPVPHVMQGPAPREPEPAAERVEVALADVVLEQRLAVRLAENQIELGEILGQRARGLRPSVRYSIIGHEGCPPSVPSCAGRFRTKRLRASCRYSFTGSSRPIIGRLLHHRHRRRDTPASPRTADTTASWAALLPPTPAPRSACTPSPIVHRSSFSPSLGGVIICTRKSFSRAGRSETGAVDASSIYSLTGAANFSIS